MASCSPLTNRDRRQRRRPRAADSNSGGDLPPDALCEILLRLPAKELCRLRLVHPSWRRVTSDPLFIKAHAARHPGPLFLASFRGDMPRIGITDLSGNVVKRISDVDVIGNMVLCNRLDHLVCVATARNYCCVLNPATGAAHVLPECPAEEHMENVLPRTPYTSFAFGQVASTGEHKVLRMFNRPGLWDVDWGQLCEVITITGGGSAPYGRWRAKQSREILVEANNSIPSFVYNVYYEMNCSTVVGGVVYFLMDDVYGCPPFAEPTVDPDHIASFDLETEQWRQDIKGPISSRFDLSEYSDYLAIYNHLKLGELREHLVLVYSPVYDPSIEMWFLTDFDNAVWVKEYNIQTESTILNNQRLVKPVVLLDDGKMVIHLVLAGVLIVYDPMTNSCAKVEMGDLHDVGVYTGSLLSLQDGDML